MTEREISIEMWKLGIAFGLLVGALLGWHRIGRGVLVGLGLGLLLQAPGFLPGLLGELEWSVRAWWFRWLP
jgi:hypothetical protein